MMIDDMMDGEMMMMKYDDEMMEQSAHMNPPLLPRPHATCLRKFRLRNFRYTNKIAE